MEFRFGNIMLTINRVDRLIGFGLSQNTDDFFCAVLPFFHTLLFFD
jgi:hypothetical protein